MSNTLGCSGFRQLVGEFEHVLERLAAKREGVSSTPCVAAFGQLVVGDVMGQPRGRGCHMGRAVLQPGAAGLLFVYIAQRHGMPARCPVTGHIGSRN